MAKGTTQKSQHCTTPGAKVTRTLRATPRQARYFPSARRTSSLALESRCKLASLATRLLKKQWVAPLSSSATAGHSARPIAMGSSSSWAPPSPAAILPAGKFCEQWSRPPLTALPRFPVVWYRQRVLHQVGHQVRPPTQQRGWPAPIGVGTAQLPWPPCPAST